MAEAAMRSRPSNLARQSWSGSTGAGPHDRRRQTEPSAVRRVVESNKVYFHRGEMDIDIIIRKAENADILIIVKFLRCMLEEMASASGHRASADESEWEHFHESIRPEIKNQDHIFLIARITKPDLTFVGFLEARIKSRMFAFEPKRVLHIHSLYVDEAYRRIGVGQALLESAIEWGKNMGCDEAELSVLVKNSAQSLYEKLGFRPFEIEMLRKL